MIQFKNWLQLNEMPHFMINGDMNLPCPILIAAGLDSPCMPGKQSNKKITMIDMRFELYPKNTFDWNKLDAFGTKFIAQIPGSDEYLIKDNEAKIMNGSIAKQSGFIPDKEIPGSISSKGYVLLPSNWLKYALLLDKDNNVIKK